MRETSQAYGLGIAAGTVAAVVVLLLIGVR